MSNELIVEISDAQNNFCNKFRKCEDCKYYTTADCKIAFVVDNYELTKKPNKELEEINESYINYTMDFREFCCNRVCDKCELCTAIGGVGGVGCIERFILAKERGIL